MLSTPNAGWSTVTIGKFTGVTSDIGDNPIKWLTSCICFLRYRVPLTLFFEEEGTTFTLVYNFGDSYIVVDRGKQEYIHLFDVYEGNGECIIWELISDIKKDIDKWKWWGFCGGDEDSKRVEDNKYKILELIAEIERLLYKWSCGSYVGGEDILE